MHLATINRLYHPAERRAASRKRIEEACDWMKTVGLGRILPTTKLPEAYVNVFMRMIRPGLLLAFRN